MKKEDPMQKKTYAKPEIEVIRINHATQLLAGSPPISVGPIVVPPGTDDNDTELDDENNGIPAKKFKMWDEWQE